MTEEGSSEDKAKNIRKEQFTRYIYDFMQIYAVIIGVLMGAGFLFLGIIRDKTVVILFALLAFLAGMLMIPTLVKEKDEYDIKDVTPRPPQESTRSQTREVFTEVSHNC